MGSDAEMAGLVAHADEVGDWLDSRFMQVSNEVDQYASGFDGFTNHYPFIGKSYTEVKQIYGYAGHDANTVDVLQGKIAIFNDDHHALFVDRTDGEIAHGEVVVGGIVDDATDANTAAIQELSDTTDALIERITLANADNQVALSAHYDDSEEFQRDERARIEGELEDLKAEILASLAAFKANIISRSWGRYNPQPLWDEINRQTEIYHDALDAARAEFGDMQADTNAQWNSDADEHDAYYEAKLRQKELDFVAASQKAAAAWSAALARANERFDTYVDEADARTAAWRAEKENDLEVRYNALKANSQNIYDFDVQSRTLAALDDERDAAAAECAARYAFLAQQRADDIAAFNAAMDYQSARHADAQAHHTAECEASVAANEAEWDQFSADLRQDFVYFQDVEVEGFFLTTEAWSTAFHAGVTAVKTGPHYGYGRYARYFPGRFW